MKHDCNEDKKSTHLQGFWEVNAGELTWGDILIQTIVQKFHDLH